MTLRDYFVIENAAETKSEFVDGSMVAMTGGMPEHSLIKTNLTVAIANRLAGGKCRAYDSDLRIITPKGRVRYPDLSVICGPLQTTPADRVRGTVTNPKVLFEVLSESSEKVDRLEKLTDYISIPTLQEYVLVSQSEPRIEALIRRKDGSWSVTFAEGLESSIKLKSLKLEIDLKDVYRDVKFGKQKKASTRTPSTKRARQGRARV